jgi:hypothetical protein
MVLVDRLAPDASVDHSLVSLPAGTGATFVVRTSADLDPKSLMTAPVLRTANDLR